MQASACNLSTRYNTSPFPTLPLDRDIWRAYTSLPFHLAGVPRNLNGKSEAHDEGKISGCVRWRKRERERGGAHATEEFSCGERKGETKGEERREAKASRQRFQLYTHTQKLLSRRGEREERREERLAW